MQPCGRFVAVVGPDGVGKSTLARVLLQQWPGTTAYVHFRPPLRGSLAALPPEVPVPGPPKGPREGNRPLGWLRLARSLAAFWLGYLRHVRPAVRRGGLVVADRWVYGYLGQPHALKFYGPPALARACLRLMPRPHLVVNLSAPADVVLRRKQELSRAEVELELATWAALPVSVLQTYSAVDAPGRIADRILSDLRSGDRVCDRS